MIAERRVRPMALIAALLVGACGPGPVLTGAPSTEATVAPNPSPIALATPEITIAPVPSAGFFAFDPESIVGYYASLGYTCTAPRPSTTAAGFDYRACQLMDPAGRTRVIGIVTDANDDVADAFASVTGAPTEAVLDPTVALEPFSAFLGAMLDAQQGEAVLPWLASHLGDAYVTTALGDLTIATYSESPDDHSKLYVEIANHAYLEAPSPAPTSP